MGGSGGLRSSPPPAPVRDASSLKAVRYGPGHEKFPSWPAAVPSRPQAGGSCRSKSWTEQTHYPKEEPPVISRPFNKRINPSFSQQLLKRTGHTRKRFPLPHFVTLS
ncbi:melanosome organization [Homalodisca vitripennis]|nr:melanosome organization [Homalodisca vitripennis]